jgi:Tol biopolymer transport system component
VVTDALALQGAPAWTPDGRSMTAAAIVDGTPHLFRVSLDGASALLVKEYSVNPVWSPGGEFLLYSGADIGTRFTVKAVTAAGRSYPFPNLTLSRGARRQRFLDGGRALAVLRGGIEHKDLWLIDLKSGGERQLTHLPADFNVRDFDISMDGHELVLERVQDQSDVVLMDLAQYD